MGPDAILERPPSSDDTCSGCSATQIPEEALPGAPCAIALDGDSFVAVPAVEDQTALRLTAADLPLDARSTSNETF